MEIPKQHQDSETSGDARSLANYGMRAVRAGSRILGWLAQATEHIADGLQSEILEPEIEPALASFETSRPGILDCCDMLFAEALELQLRLPPEERTKFFINPGRAEGRQTSTYVAVRGLNGKQMYVFKPLLDDQSYAYKLKEQLEGTEVSTKERVEYDRFITIYDTGFVELKERASSSDIVRRSLSPAEYEPYRTLLEQPTILHIIVPLAAEQHPTAQ